MLVAGWSSLLNVKMGSLPSVKVKMDSLPSVKVKVKMGSLPSGEQCIAMMGPGDLLSSNFPEGINGEGEFWKVVIDKKKLDPGGRRRN